MVDVASCTVGWTRKFFWHTHFVGKNRTHSIIVLLTGFSLELCDLCIDLIWRTFEVLVVQLNYMMLTYVQRFSSTTECLESSIHLAARDALFGLKLSRKDHRPVTHIFSVFIESSLLLPQWNERTALSCFLRTTIATRLWGSLPPIFLKQLDSTKCSTFCSMYSQHGLKINISSILWLSST